MNKFIALILLITPTFLQAEVWPYFRHDTLGAAISPYEGPIECNIVCQVNIEWSFASPVIDDSNRLFILGKNPVDGSDEWYLWCINTHDCSVRWTYQIGTTDPSGSIYSSCAISPTDNTVYLGYLAALYAINADGTYKWKYITGGSIQSSPVIGNDGTIYVGCNDNYLYAINPDSTLKWRYQTTSALHSSPAIGSDGTIYIGAYANRVYAVNSNGTLRWTYGTGGAVESSPAIGEDGTIYIGSSDAKLYALTSAGNLKWSYVTSGAIRSSPAIDNFRGAVFIGNDSVGTGNLYAIDTSGTLKWRTPLGAMARYASPAIAFPNNMVYMGTSQNGSGYSRLYAIEGATGNIVCYTTHTYLITSPAIDKPYDGQWCVWYYEYCDSLHKICYTDIVGKEEDCDCKRKTYTLSQNEPNPFTTGTNISFFLPAKTYISLKIYDISGRTIKTLAEGEYVGGKHTVKWDAKNTMEGIYFCELRTGARTLIRKMVLMK